jgi:hypothetical protein
MTTKSRVLLISNVEFGHSNTFLAVAQTLLKLNNDVELHYASFKGLRERVKNISNQALRDNPSVTPIQFHTLSGLGALEATLKRQPDLWDLYHLTPGFWNTLKTIDRLIVTLMNPYTGPEYVEVLSSAIEVIKDIAPDLVVFDNALPPAMAACVKTGVKYVVLSPNTLKDLLAPTQPNAAVLWKYPM